MTLPVAKDPEEWTLREFLLLLNLEDFDLLSTVLSSRQIQAAVLRLQELLEVQPDFSAETFIFPSTELDEEIQAELAGSHLSSLPLFEQLATLQAALNNL